MPDLPDLSDLPLGFRVAPVDGAAMLGEWRHVHNVIVPPAAMSLDAVRERSGRYRLENAYVGDVLVGRSTVRPPEGGRGRGDPYRARAAADEDGLRFALARGFVEVERYVLPGESDLWIDLRLGQA